MAQAERKLAGMSDAVQNTRDSCREICLHTQSSQLNKEGRKHNALPESAALGKTKTEIHVESPDTSLNTLCKMAVINGGHEKRAGKMLKKLERNVSYTHSAGYNNTETFCSSSYAGSLRFHQGYQLPSKHCLLSQVLA